MTEVAGKTQDSKVDYYAMLKISKTATEKEITQAYRKLALRYEPLTQSLLSY